MNGSAPFCRNGDVGWDVTRHYPPGTNIKAFLSDNPPDLDENLDFDTPSDDSSVDGSPSRVHEYGDYQVRWWYPTVVPSHGKIQIPTAHIQAKQDPLTWQAENMYDLCAPESRALLKHEGGHGIPLRGPVLEQMVEVIEKADGRGLLGA